MKKCEYLDVQVQDPEERQLELDSGKKDEANLPQFSKHVPTSSKKTVRGDSMTVEYKWKECNCDKLHFKNITFRKGEDIGNLFRLDARDGADSVSLVHNNTVLIFRKTTKEIAKALYNAYSKVKEGIENIAGWLQTVLGTAYVVSKVEKLSWSFDKRLVRGGKLNYLEAEKLDDEQKKSLCDMIIQNLAVLHSKGLVLGKFTLNSVVLTKEDVLFTDLRGLRASRKKSYGVEEFKALMQYLFARGMVKPEDTYYSVAMYHTLNEDGCAHWYKEKNGKPADALEITNILEQEIF